MALTILPLSFSLITCCFSVSILHMSFYYVIINLRNFCQAAVSIKISNLLICYFCSFDLSCPIFETDNFIENLDIVLFCLIKSFLTLFVLIYHTI